MVHRFDWLAIGPASKTCPKISQSLEFARLMLAIRSDIWRARWLQSWSGDCQNTNRYKNLKLPISRLRYFTKLYHKTSCSMKTESCHDNPLILVGNKSLEVYKEKCNKILLVESYTVCDNNFYCFANERQLFLCIWSVFFMTSIRCFATRLGKNCVKAFDTKAICPAGSAHNQLRMFLIKNFSDIHFCIDHFCTFAVFESKSVVRIMTRELMIPEGCIFRKVLKLSLKHGYF